VDVAKVIDGWRRRHPQATPSDLYFRITTESTMGLNASTLALRKSGQGGAPVFLYRLEWETPVDGGRMRSPHTLDIPLVFDNVAKASTLIGTGSAQAQQVSDVMSAAWLAFARYGTPNAPGLPSWPAFTAQSRATMIFDVTSRAVNDPLHAERLLLPQAPPN
jgi:para-nitrobenzyl esterase